MTPQQQEDLAHEEQRAQTQRLSGPLPSGMEQPQRPSSSPEPPPVRASSNSDQDSHCSDSNDCYTSGRSLGWIGEDSYHSDGPRSDSSWEDDSNCDSSVHSYDSCGSDYDSISTEQRVCEYIDYDPCISDGDSNSRKDSSEGKSPGSEDGRNKKDGEVTSSELQAPEAPPESPPETTEERTVLLCPGPSFPLSSGSIAAL